MSGNVKLRILSQTPVATLQVHSWSNVCSKFHENRGILKPISRNRDVCIVYFTQFFRFVI